MFLEGKKRDRAESGALSPLGEMKSPQDKGSAAKPKKKKGLTSVVELTEIDAIDLMVSLSSSVLCSGLERNNLFWTSNDMHEFVPSSITTTWEAISIGKRPKWFTPISTWSTWLTSAEIPPNTVHVGGRRMPFGCHLVVYAMPTGYGLSIGFSGVYPGINGVTSL